jgi:hypothetical protein
MGSAPVIVELRGRLGNQLFEFAAAYALSRRLGCELLFSSRRLAPAPLELPRLLGDLYREADSRQLLRVGRFHYRIRGRRFVDAALRIATRARSHLTGHAYIVDSTYIVDRAARHRADSRVLEARPPCVLRGYFENERYFSDLASDVDRAIRLPSLADVLPEDLARPIVGVSFRRGDFNSMGWTLPLDYYEAALSTLCERVRPGTLMVFADDRGFSDLAEPWLRRFGPVVNGARFSDDLVANLAMLAACDHNVIANSTFSWWGAWLAERRAPTAADRLVLAPAGWRRGRPADVIPDRWTAVSW